MEENKTSNKENDNIEEDRRSPFEYLGSFILYKIIHPIIIFGTLILLLFFLLYFIILAFKSNITDGIRSLAGALTPFIIAIFLSIFIKGIFKKLSEINKIVKYILFLILGFASMVLIQFLKNININIPLNELLLSLIFSILFVSYAKYPSTNKVFVYYYGFVTGFLIYLIFLGFPI